MLNPNDDQIALATTTLDASYWRERAQRLEAEVRMLRRERDGWANFYADECKDTDALRAEVDRLTDGIREADDYLRSVVEMSHKGVSANRLQGIYLKVRSLLDVAGDEVTHRCPPEGEAVMPCCGRTPFEVPRTDRVTIDDALATCVAGDDRNNDA